MRVLAVPLALLVVALIATLLVIAFRGPSRARIARWEALTELRDDVTVVFVRHTSGTREVGRQVIAELPAGLPDWESRYHEAMAEARSRAAALESETD
jgi:hypothetical protein